ncbi:MAG: acyl-CoA dehydrogenase family protein [Mycolicibacterium sp.]|uniref:acyl-CoA dehydrogenase family protein n=1 Tax=Mycolicibacterium sp. TaxID=2320850 RepID=UPI003D0A1163
MDFTPDEGQQAVADVVTSVLARDNSWEALVDGGVTALGVPERLGGDGVGLAQIATALNEIGRHGTVGPALATLGCTAALLELASEAQQDRYLGGVAKGAVLTFALNEPGESLPDRPSTALSGNRITGTKIAVGYAGQADWILVSTDGGVVVVSGSSEGLTVTKTPTSNGSDEFVVCFDNVRVDECDVLVGASTRRLNQLVLAVTGAFVSGLVAGALRLTADYVATREQFGRPLSTFQTVAAQLSEIYIASRTISLLATSAVWLLSEGQSDAPESHADLVGELAVLGYWLTSQAPPAMRTCHHLHGGMGMDITYPMNRYYSAVKDLTRMLGGPSHRLDLVGASTVAGA